MSRYFKSVKYRQTLFYCALLCCSFTDNGFFLQIENLWQRCVEQVYQHHFNNSICLLCVSVLQVILAVFQTFALLFICYGDV